MKSPSTLPIDTFLEVVISQDRGSFLASGKVIYVHERIGMGVVFIEPPDEHLAVLDSWLADAAQKEA